MNFKSQSTVSDIFESFLNVLSVTVTDDFIRYADGEYASGGYSSRLNIDALLLEYVMITNNLVRPPEHFAHDFIIEKNGDRFLIDVKEINSVYFNIMSQDKLNKYKRRVDDGTLTHFLMYSDNRDKSRLLETGDKIKFAFIDFLLAKDVLCSVQKSHIHPGSFYYRIQK